MFNFFFRETKGECWAGHKSKHRYSALGNADPSNCIGDDYKPCGKFDRYCMGRLYTNMVYELGELNGYKIILEVLSISELFYCHLWEKLFW